MFFKKWSARKTKSRMGNKTKTNARKNIPDNRYCMECEYADYNHGNSIANCTYTCMLNPKKPVKMGGVLHAKHEFRNKNKEEQNKKRGRK